jgi:hypothetical protein
VAETDTSQHAAAFVGHLLTNPAVRTAAKAAGANPAEFPAEITKVINTHLGTNLTPEQGLAVANETKARLGALKAAPQTVTEAEGNIVLP